MGAGLALPRRQVRELRRHARTHPAVRTAHRRERIGLWRYVLSGDLATLITAPLVYSVFIPFAVLDLWVTAYQAVCFRAWHVRPVRRRHYFAIDRHKLAYLNAIEKFNCLFCSYTNGLTGYVREIASRTEAYWCPIRHARRVRGVHDRYPSFAPYGDSPAYRQRLAVLRAAAKR
jgi:hypothetical protein